jgi:LuxR family maltose regulon positive regulatory protein
MGNQVRRDVLLARLDAALERRLTLIHAPAGYGKTSLLSQWRNRVDGASTLVAWLTLERDDADPRRLAQYIALAVDGGMDAEGERKLADLPPRAALSAIINRLAREPRRVVLILDDLHLAEGAPVGEFLKALIQLAPPNCRFIVASRDYPWLGQSILAAEEQLLELHAEDLKFSAEEAQALLGRGDSAELAGEDVARIVERTEGWAIALQLTSLSLKRGADHRQLVAHFSGASSELARYLSEQVLMTLPEETQRVVMRTALLDHVTGDTINLLCDRQDGWLLLERLEQQGVVLTPLSPDRQAYRYHQLFAEYLRERLARGDAALFRTLHRRAALWFGERGEVVEAVNHAIQAGDHALLAMVLEDAGGWRLLPQGLQALVERGLAELPAATIAAHPRLVLAQIYLEVKRGQMEAARVDYDRFVAKADPDLSADLWTEIRVVGDVLVEYENLPMTFETLLEREALLRTLPADDHLVLANFNESLGAKYYEGGWLERSLEPTLAAREHYQALGSLYSDLFTRFHEARIKRAQGRMQDAVVVLATAREEIERGFGARSDLAANCAAFEAELLYEQDRAPEALALLEWALPHMELFDGWVDVYAAAYFTAARIAAGDGALDAALALLDRARLTAERRRFPQLALLTNLCELELLLHHADLDDARAMAERIELDALAEPMREESPRYRAVAVAAAMSRARLRLLDGDHETALADLAHMRRWASQHGAGRLLIDVNLLRAHGLRQAGDIARAQAGFDEAVGVAMFQGVVRPFVDARRFSRDLVEAALGGAPRIDRFRAQFLRDLSRAIASRPAAPVDDDALNDAETAILAHLSYGYSNKEIARLIGMSPDTVKYRLKSVFRKIGVNKRRDAVRVSRERGFLPGAEPAAP